MKRFYLIITILFVGVSALWSQHANVIWNTPSRNSSESMPCGGGNRRLLESFATFGSLLNYLSSNEI